MHHPIESNTFSENIRSATTQNQSTMPRNFITNEMKINFFDNDEEDRNVTPLSNEAMEKLLEALTYGVQRCSNRNTGLQISVVLGPEVLVAQQHLDRIVAHLGEKAVDVRVTDRDLVVGFAHGWPLMIKLQGGAGFTHPKEAALNESTETAGSAYDEYLSQGLTQECLMAVPSDGALEDFKGI